MKPIIVMVLLVASATRLSAQQPDPNAVLQSPRSAGGTSEYFNANGRLIGSVTTIAGVVYFTGADGAPLGTGEWVGDQFVYKAR